MLVCTVLLRLLGTHAERNAVTGEILILWVNVRAENEKAERCEICIRIRFKIGTHLNVRLRFTCRPNHSSVVDAKNAQCFIFAAVLY